MVDGYIVGWEVKGDNSAESYKKLDNSAER